MIDHFKRYQPGLTLNDLYPKIDGYCACGCNKLLIKPNKKWYSTDCRTNAYYNFAVVKGNNFVIREQLYLKDGGACQCCGVFSDNWQADHILPVYLGGGGLGLSNFQTLCDYCHLLKTHSVGHRKAISSQDNSTLFMADLKEPVAETKMPVNKSNEIASLGLDASPDFTMCVCT